MKYFALLGHKSSFIAHTVCRQIEQRYQYADLCCAHYLDHQNFEYSSDIVHRDVKVSSDLQSVICEF